MPEGEEGIDMMSLARKYNGPYCSRFGTIAVELGFISRAQLKQSLDEQVEDDLSARPHRVLGAICFAHGWMTPEQIDIVLNRMFKARVQRGSRANESQQAPG
ncbi:MAG: hypothetical protein GXP51_07480 [Deltaproteobacteria bacterium]|nr:hypothetical protein [Deltaproteobacteria bacterium]